MSSVLDALTPAERAEVIGRVEYRRLERYVVGAALIRLLEEALTRTISVPPPGTGADWTIAPPDGAWWEVLFVREQLSTSSTVASRAPLIDVRDQDNVRVFQFPPQAAVSASTVQQLGWASGYGTLAGTAIQVMPLSTPAPIVRSGWSLQSDTVNVDSGDSYAAIRVGVREWSPLRVVTACRKILADVDSSGGVRYLDD